MKLKYLVTKSELRAAGKKRATYHTFDNKSLEIQLLINEVIHILDSLGIPIEGKTPRKLERMALTFLALCDVKNRSGWQQAKSLQDRYLLKTRDIIGFLNQHFAENISRGSYDDIRRKDLKHLILAEIVIPAFPNTARNDPKRAWAINPSFIEIVRGYASAEWAAQVGLFMADKPLLRDRLASHRDMPKIPITLPSGSQLEFGLGEHNLLQKAIIEQFLPRYGYGADVIYIGDAEDKFLYYDRAVADKIGLAQLAHAELPDVIAFSKQKNWLYLIEAVHSSGPMSAERLIALQPLHKNCLASPIYITAFLDRATFRKFIADIAWETEVWIASEPDHLIHFDGEKFLGPYQPTI